MVAPKAGNKRRVPGSGGPPGNRNKRFKPNMLMANTIVPNIFQASQIPDNPGYLDFNDPLQSPTTTNNSRNNPKANKRPFRNQGIIGNGIGKVRQPNGGIPLNNHAGGNWRGNKNNLRNNRSNNNRVNRGPTIPMIPNRMGPRMGGRGPMVPPGPPPPMGIMGGPRPPLPPSFMPSRMGPGPMCPPPMIGPPLPPMGVPGPRGPPRIPVARRMGLRSGNAIQNDPALRRKNQSSNIPTKGGKARKGKTKNNVIRTNQVQNIQRNSRTAKRNRASSSKKTLKEILNQYSLDKPWVTEEIKKEAKLKEDIENKLKGKKDDKLFAEFKVQRDKFVAMYESAKKEYMDKKKAPKKDTNNESKQSDKGEKNANTSSTT